MTAHRPVDLAVTQLDSGVFRVLATSLDGQCRLWQFGAYVDVLPTLLAVVLPRVCGLCVD